MDKKKMLLICGLFPLLTLQAFDLVKDGKAVSQIILNREANASQRLAAEDLRHFVGKISGALLPLNETADPAIANQIHIGVSEAVRKLGFEETAFQNSGYQIRVRGNIMVLSGYDRLAEPNRFRSGNAAENLKKWRTFAGDDFTLMQINNGAGQYQTQLKIHITDDTGTWYAVSALLEQLGVRFYAPYEDGTVVPEKKNLSVEDQDTRVQARFGRRHWFFGRGEPEGVKWLKRTGAGNYNLVEFNHMTYAILTSKEFRKKYPNFYAQMSPGAYYNGYPAGSGMPRLTDPGFRAMSIKLARKVFDAYPDLQGLCMGVPDGGLKLDYRDLGLYPGDTDQQGSDILWDYTRCIARAIKESHPGKYLIYMPYGGCRKIPANGRKDDPDNVVLGYPVSSSANRVEKYLDRIMFDNLGKWNAFFKSGKKHIIWDYFLYYRKPNDPRFPVMFTKYLQSEMQRLVPYADGKFIELSMEYTSNGIPLKQPEAWRIGEAFALSPMIYWQNKLFWDPDADRETILNEYYRLFYGPAEKEMKKFFEYAEAVWCRQESRSVTQSSGFLKEGDVAEYFRMLEAAAKKTAPDSVYRRRINQLIKAYSPIRTLFGNLKRKGPDVRLFRLGNDTVLDGNPGKYPGSAVRLRHKDGRFPVMNHTEFKIALSEDSKYLYVIVTAYENNMDRLRANTTRNDDEAVFNDDLIELYLNTPQRSYFKIAVNPAGARWDESTDPTIINRDTLPVLWNPDIKTFVRKYPDRWVVEMKIPTADFHSPPPTRTLPWGIQVGRTRMAGKDGMQWYSLGCGPGGYSIIPQWGNLWTR